MWGGEMLELDKARKDIFKRGFRDKFFIGCDTEGYEAMDKDYFLDVFSDTFNYATVTHYLNSFHWDENKYTYRSRNEQVNELRKRGIEVEGRPIFWADECCTPEWLQNKNYSELFKYLEKHTREVVGHYGDKMYAWEIINEAHDFNNIMRLKPEQMVEVAGFIADVAKDTAPNVHRLINNCCLQASYVQLVDWSKFDEKFDIITPHRFIKMCHEAGVDFDITGQQLYFQYTNRDLADNIRMTERLEKYGRPVQITEIGTTSGPTKQSIMSGEMELPELPYPWHRHWDEELQADWLEQIYTIMYSKEWVEAINWYDLIDTDSFIPNGAMLRSPKGPTKPVYERVKSLVKQWKSI
jgi:GH35 family endo-1,4-beta-xylanase